MIKNLEKVRVGRISYINVAPVYYGLDRSIKPDWLELVTAPPAELNRRLEEGSIDISPVSSAAYAKNHRDWLIMPDLSISSDGNVLSVLLVSHSPVNMLDGKKVLLSEESASAASLVRYLLSSMGSSPQFISSRVCSPSDVNNEAEAALVIGDAALTEDWAGAFEYVTDLGALWKETTGLPFVFAVWAVRKTFAERHPERLAEIASLFVESKKQGRVNYPEIISSASLKTGLSVDLCERYFDYLNCDLGEKNIKGLETFFDGLYKCKIISERVRVEFARVVSEN